MERAVKERTVGAVVLMVFIVLVVPVFLDGPDPEPAVVSETVTLPGQNGQPRKRQTIVLERDRREPVPVPGAADTGRDDTAPPAATGAATAVPLPPAGEPAARAAATPPEPAGAEATADAGAESPPQSEAPAGAAARSATGMWAVQLGSFSNKDNAERLASALRDKGYAAFLSRLQGADGALHRVRVGPQKDRDSAEAMAARLASEGHRGQVVPHP